MKPEMIMCGSSRMVGKDTFFNLLNKLYPNQFIRFAFADALKYELEHICIKMFNKNIANLNPREKEILRPVLISFGCAWREIDPLHWVKLTYEKIIETKSFCDAIPISSDTRFSNEVEYFKNLYGDKCIFVEINRIGAPEPTEEEKRNIPLLKKYVDYSLTWPSAKLSLDELEPYVVEFYSKYFS